MTAALNLGALIYSALLILGGYYMFRRNVEKTRYFVICVNSAFSIMMFCCCLINMRCYELLQMAVTVTLSLAFYTIVLNLLLELCQNADQSVQQTQN